MDKRNRIKHVWRIVISKYYKSISDSLELWQKLQDSRKNTGGKSTVDTHRWQWLGN